MSEVDGIGVNNELAFQKVNHYADDATIEDEDTTLQNGNMTGLPDEELLNPALARAKVNAMMLKADIGATLNGEGSYSQARNVVKSETNGKGTV